LDRGTGKKIESRKPLTKNRVNLRVDMFVLFYWSEHWRCISWFLPNLSETSLQLLWTKKFHSAVTKLLKIRWEFVLICSLFSFVHINHPKMLCH